ncbi:acetyltransferase [Microbacterium sp.]|uniref:acetyltransferase n=1 Tax=Microbacterium sp. TaxID=51671 RepID=UPI002735CD13|nr:acetyltransferase [Microbacterium sp.]MDP3949100.1 acetyltransferase [Microbacterium sp.]
MAERVVIVGAGGFGRETIDVIMAAIEAGEPVELLGVVDSGPREADLERLALRGVAYLGTENEWLPVASGDERFIVAIGSPVVREGVAGRFANAGLRAATAIHPRAVVGSQVRIGDGVVIASGVQISTNVSIGDHVHLNPGSIVGHDATLAEFVSVNPGAVISGAVSIGRTTLVGAAATVLQNLTIGVRVTIGAGACVTKNVGDWVTVVGVPARDIRADRASTDGE